VFASTRDEPPAGWKVIEVGAFTDCWTIVMLTVLAGTLKGTDSPTVRRPRDWTVEFGPGELSCGSFVHAGAPPPATRQAPPGGESLPQDATATRKGRAKRALERMRSSLYRDGTAGCIFKDGATP
jgi:hypothetical protein